MTLKGHRSVVGFALGHCITGLERKWVTIQHCTSSSAPRHPNMGKLTGKVAIVTASTEGIGLAIARRLAQDGAFVMISSRKQANVDRTVDALRGEGLDVAGVVCHVGKPEHRERLVEETVKAKGGVDILVCNAAVNPVMGGVLETPESAWDKIFEVNLKTTFLLIRDVVPHMESRGGGSVVLVGSIGGFNPHEMMGAYGVSKTAMMGLTKVLAQPLGEKNITVNCIAPGLIKTKFAEALWKNEALAEAVLEKIPLGRLGVPEDCSGVVSFLVSQDAAYVTGETIVIAGGTHARL